MKDLLDKAQQLHILLKDITKHDNNSLWMPNLCGACALSALVVYKIAKSLGYEALLDLNHSFKNGTHCWTIVNGKIIDCTATQFSELKDLIKEGILIADTQEVYRSVMLEDGDFYNDPSYENDFLYLTSCGGDPEDEFGTISMFNKYKDIINKTLNMNLELE
jgi:hypothetical protein